MQPTVFKTDILFDKLRQELSKYAPGDKFMTSREIMKRFSVSQLVVDQTVARFREAGLLQVVPGRGTFATDAVRRFHNSAPATYLFAVPRWNSTELTLLEEYINKIQSRYSSATLLLHRFDYTEEIPQDLQLQEENIKGVALLTSSSALWNANNLAKLERYASEVPLVIMNRHHGDIPMISVGADDIYAGNIAVSHLLNHGHRKIAVLVSEPHNSIINDRIRGIMTYAKLHDMECEILDCDVHSGEHAPDKTYRYFTETIKHGIDFTGLIGISSDSFIGAVNACLNSGIKIPEQLSLVTIGQRRIAEIQYPPLDCVDLNMEGQVDAIMEILTHPDNFTPQSNPYEYIEPSLIIKGSTIDK